ncbi:hypothetical protein SLS62_009364 [Diatrype stigma]|uniref:Pre-mRNA-splicing factor 38B n=1 Tax=Diatrype stigma TaxID=117547 RepID=A0AAN9YKW4_9PEZI
MSTKDILTDDYVAELLAKEADDCSLKYSAMGLDAYKASKRPASHLKPNTRFLNNIIRDTNSHNRLLLAKENAESQARLRELDEAEKRKQREEERKLRRMRPGLSDTRKRMLGDIAAHLSGPSKRRKTESSTRPATSNAEQRGSSSKEPDAGASGVQRSGRESEKSRGPSRRRDRVADEDDDDHARDREASSSKTGSDRRHTHHHHHGKSHHRDSRRRSPGSEERREGHPRSRSPRRSRDNDRSSGGGGRESNSRRKRQRSRSSESHRNNNTSDSDPLDDIIGPVPPRAPEDAVVHRRGRGANAGNSGIDSRFAADYDPRLDVTPEPDDHHGVGGANEDWDNAVETFRDRLKWQQQGAERLRAAGFSESDIRKWEKSRSDGQKDEADVRWNERGGLREWDRGKVVGDDGQVTVEAEWGRLKGT